MSRPEKEKITTESLTAAIKTDGGLRVEPQFRGQLRNLLKDARDSSDRTGIAYAAFTLAYSLDHYEPYDFSEAVQLLGEVLTYFPEWTEAYFNRGVARIHLKDFEGSVQDFETANSHYSRRILGGGESTPQINLLRGKLLMFLAEAHSRRGNPGDLDVAKSELLRAEPYLLQCLWHTDPQTRASAQFWIDEIPKRLKAIFPNEEKKPTAAPVTHPLAFLIGLILVPFILWWVVATITAEKVEAQSKPDSLTPLKSAGKPSGPNQDGPAESSAEVSQEKEKESL